MNCLLFESTSTINVIAAFIPVTHTSVNIPLGILLLWFPLNMDIVTTEYKNYSNSRRLGWSFIIMIKLLFNSEIWTYAI